MASDPDEVSVADHGSIWSASTPAGPVCPPLAGAATTDTVVIGAGFTGLSTALNLRKAGVDPDQPGKTWWELQKTAGEIFDRGGKCPLTTVRFACC